jgi:two-component system chemotaxis response regulator CheB
MPLPKIRVLIVDDSGLMRLLITDMLSQSQEIEVVDTAENGKDAVEKTLALLPDVVVLDLIMKDYDGVYAVKEIMKQRPTPIILLSSLGNANPDAVFEVMKLGAYTFINKPDTSFSSKIREITQLLINKIKQAACASVKRVDYKETVNHYAHTFPKELPYHIIVIGASTGGTGAIEDILKQLPANLPLPIVIAQHMPKEFVYSFAERLNALLPLQVSVAQKNETLLNGRIYIAPTGTHNLVITRDEQTKVVKFDYTDTVFPEFNYPSVNCLFLSAAAVYSDKVIAIILSGMGKDGAVGMQSIFQKGGYTIAQNEATSVVFGMPKEAIATGSVKTVLPIEQIAGFVVSCLG